MTWDWNAENRYAFYWGNGSKKNKNLNEICQFIFYWTLNATWQFKNSQQNISSDCEYWKHFIFIKNADIGSKSILRVAAIPVRNYLDFSKKQQYSWSSAHWRKNCYYYYSSKKVSQAIRENLFWFLCSNSNLDPFCFDYYKQRTEIIEQFIAWSTKLHMKVF